MEALEIKDTALVNQINQPQIHTPNCTYCQAQSHVFEKCPVCQAHQIFHENMSYSMPHNNSYSQTYNSGWRNHPNFCWNQNNHDHPRPNFFKNFHHLSYQQNFPNQASHSSFQPPTGKKLSKLEKSGKHSWSPNQPSCKIQDNFWTTMHMPYFD